MSVKGSIPSTSAMPPQDDAMAWAQWPAERPRPSQEEWDAAIKRYRAEMDRAYGEGYSGDAGMGLSFMMATYSRGCWWDFFFPGERLPLKFEDEGFQLKCRPSRYDKVG